MIYILSAVAERQTVNQKPDLIALSVPQLKTLPTAKVTTTATGKRPHKTNALKGVVVKKKQLQPKIEEAQGTVSQGPAKRKKTSN